MAEKDKLITEISPHPPNSAIGSSFDAALARVMSDVPLPLGLTERLHAAMVPSPDHLSSQSPTSRPRYYSPQRLMLGIGTAAVFLIALSWLIQSGAILTETDVRRLAALDTNTLPVASSRTTIAVPSGWQSLYGLEFAERPVMATGDAPSIPLLPLTYRADQRLPPVTGFLLTLPESHWRGRADATSFSIAEVRYTASGTWTIWREGSTVFIFVLNGDTRAMELLQRAAINARNVT